MEGKGAAGTMSFLCTVESPVKSEVSITEQVLNKYWSNARKKNKCPIINHEKSQFLLFLSISKSYKRDFSPTKKQLYDCIKICISKPDKCPGISNCLCSIGASKSTYLNALITCLQTCFSISNHGGWHHSNMTKSDQFLPINICCISSSFRIILCIFWFLLICNEFLIHFLLPVLFPFWLFSTLFFKTNLSKAQSR